MSPNGNLVTGAELGRLLRPARPWHRDTINHWTREGYMPKGAVVFFGKRTLYSVARLIEAGWLHPGTVSERAALTG